MGRKKYNLEFATEVFRERGYELLEKTYKNVDKKMKYLCNKHGIKEISLYNLLKGSGCRECAFEKLANDRKHEFGYIVNEFKKKNYTLLEIEYINAQKKMRYICNKHPNEIRLISYNTLQSGHGCKDCAFEKIADEQKLDYEIVKEEFSKRNYVLLDDVYINGKTKVRYICKKHSDIVQEIRVNNLRSGQGCYFCGLESSGFNRKYKQKEVEDIFKERGFTVKSKYIDSKHQLEFVCDKHPEYIQTATITDVLSGKKSCRYCWIESIKGENSNLWKGGRTNISNFLRGKIIDWKKKSMDNCNYTCIISGEQFKAIHHLVSFNILLEETFKETNIPIFQDVGEYSVEQLEILSKKIMEIHERYPLGVCLTRSLHREFHNIYGYINTPEQFYEFKKFKEKGLDYKQIMEIKEGVVS